jgi:hypothetical protein
MDVIDMVRWILGPEWVLDITIYTYDECCGDGKVDTKTGVGGHLSSFPSLCCTWAILSFFFSFLSCLEHVSPSSLFFLFCIAHVSF